MALVQPHGPAGSGTFLSRSTTGELPVSPGAARVLAHLHTLFARLGRRPRREDLDPGMLGSAIMRIMLLDPASGDRPSRIRLAGGVVCDALGLEPRGRRLDEVLSRQSAADLLGLTKALSDDRPVGTWAGTITRYDSAPMAAKGLIVALSPSGDVGAGCATEAGGQLVFFDELKLWAQGRSVRPRIERTLEPMT